MIVNIRQSKARLSELVGKAVAGEEVVITVRGQPTARIVGISRTSPLPDLRAWAAERRAALDSLPGDSSDSSAEILNDLRGDRH